MNKILLILLFITLPLMAQDRKTLTGRVVDAENTQAPIAGVFVINKQTGVETKTDGAGNFTASAKTGDVLAVYSNKNAVHDFIVTNQSFKDKPYLLAVKVTAYELDEVVVEGEAVTTESLNLVDANQKQLTSGEKRLRAAANARPTTGLTGTGGVGVPTDGLMNMVSGRKKMLKRALATEQKEAAIAKVNSLYSTKDIVDFYKIPEDYVQGFIYYAVEYAELTDALKANNKDNISAAMNELALDYLTVIKKNE